MTLRSSGYPDRYKPAFGHMVHPVARSGISDFHLLAIGLQQKVVVTNMSLKPSCSVCSQCGALGKEEELKRFDLARSLVQYDLSVTV